MFAVGIAVPSDDVMVISDDDEAWEARQTSLGGMGIMGGDAGSMQVQFNYSCTRKASTFVPVKCAPGRLTSEPFQSRQCRAICASYTSSLRPHTLVASGLIH